MQYRKLHCWDCGAQVVAEAGGRFYAMPTLREVTFTLSDGGYMESPFCQACAEKAWPQERLDAFKEATDKAAGQKRPFTITAAEKVESRTLPIAGVLA